jgi:hypothetical protein
MTTELQVEVEPVPVADFTLEPTAAKAQAQGNGVRASLSYLLGGSNTAVRYPWRCTIPSVPCYRRFRSHPVTFSQILCYFWQLSRTILCFVVSL